MTYIRPESSSSWSYAGSFLSQGIDGYYCNYLYSEGDGGIVPGGCYRIQMVCATGKPPEFNSCAFLLLLRVILSHFGLMFPIFFSLLSFLVCLFPLLADGVQLSRSVHSFTDLRFDVCTRFANRRAKPVSCFLPFSFGVDHEYFEFHATSEYRDFDQRPLI